MVCKKISEGPIGKSMVCFSWMELKDEGWVVMCPVVFYLLLR